MEAKVYLGGTPTERLRKDDEHERFRVCLSMLEVWPGSFFREDGARASRAAPIEAALVGSCHVLSHGLV